ncbi:MAG: glucose-1-phosphate cytidylyltransferase [Thermoplasmatales archaeon]|nr:glucose-1-phosphate cytidylyltransferase [Thermoplasmatales archaeon]
MKVVILAGGLGTRLSEETVIKPKPMVEIGSEPILWHIMKIYSHFGFNDFVICGGYKQEMIKQYFSSYVISHSTVRVTFSTSRISVLDPPKENWDVTIVDTGYSTMTGGRIKRIKKFVEGENGFMVTYGDGLANIDINKLLEYHRNKKKIVTVTAVQPKGRFGALAIGADGLVTNFTEKPPGDGMWVNGGFYVMEDELFDYIEGDETVWEGAPMSQLCAERKVSAYVHRGFWRPMDTMTDKRELESMWNSGNAPWKVWG